MIDVSIIWDLEDYPDGNVQHIAEHGVTVDEAEEVLLDPRMIYPETAYEVPPPQGRNR